MIFGIPLLSAVLWVGGAQVDVMIWEPGGEHPYKTVFDLEYVEETRTPLLSLKGGLIGYSVQLLPRRIAIDAHHEVRGLLNCTGGGQEVVTEPPFGELVIRARGTHLPEKVKDEGLPGGRPFGFVVPATGAYQLVLPWAIGAFACGSRKNSEDRRVVVGSHLFYPDGDVDAADTELRLLEAEGSRMRGSFDFSDARLRAAVRHDYHVTWDLRRILEP